MRRLLPPLVLLGLLGLLPGPLPGLLPGMGAAPAHGKPDLAALRAEYDRLRDELARARARAQLVKEAIYTAKLSASLRWKGAPDYVIHRAELRLDGADLWSSGDKGISGDLIKVAERGIKPGPHALTLRLEVRPGTKTKDADKLGYVSEHQFALLIPDGKTTRVSLVGDEDGDAPEYEPEVEVEVESE